MIQENFNVNDSVNQIIMQHYYNNNKILLPTNIFKIMLLLCSPAIVHKDMYHTHILNKAVPEGLG